MAYWTETEGKITNVQCVFDDVFVTIGIIEQPYNNNVYVATGSNNETLQNGNSFIFNEFDAAYNAIIEAFERDNNSRAIRKKVAVSTLENNGLVDLYKEGK